MGWGVHEIDDSPVFIVQLEKDPEFYAHEFYIDEHTGENVLHHRMMDVETNETKFTHAFEDDSEARAILRLLLAHQSYWLGFSNVEGDTITDIHNAPTQFPEPEDGVFVQQIVHEPVVKELVKIAEMLFINNNDNDD